MKKRLILFILSFVCISVTASAFSYTLTYLKAALNTYAAGGTATGRINKAPANL